MPRPRTRRAPRVLPGGDLTGNYPNPNLDANSVASAQVVNQSLTGADINEASFECSSGTVQSFALFTPASMVAAPTFATNGVSVARKCSGGTVQAHRIAAGQYRIRFNGSPAVLAFCQVLEAGDQDPFSDFVSLSVISAGNWRVRVVDVNGVAQDNRFECMVI
jgi:hypothetical protein